jgi:hypothetical protein
MSKGRTVPPPTPREAAASVELITTILDRAATRWTEAGLCPPAPDREEFLSTIPLGARMFDWSGILQAGLPPPPDDRPLMRMVCAKQWIVMGAAMMIRGHVADPDRVPEEHVERAMTILANTICDEIPDEASARGTCAMLMEEIKFAVTDFDGWFSGHHLNGGAQ